MPLSYVEYAAKTTADTYTIDFKFLDSSHVKLSVTTGGVLVDHTNFTINSDGTIMTVAGTYAAPIKIYRQTPGTTSATKNDQVIDFQDGSVISESDLDRSSLQALYASQESKDYVDDSVEASTGVGEMPTTTNANYILSSGTGVTPTPTWISSATLQPLLPAAVANTANTIPIRSADDPPTITSTFVGDITGNVTGDVTGSADTLNPGKTISLSGDVTYTSPVYTGSGNISEVATVSGIRGDSVSVVSPAEGQVLAFRDTTWVPESPKRVAVYSGLGAGDAIASEKAQSVDWDEEDINTTGGSVVGPSANDYFTLGIGTYLVSWSVPFLGGSCACYTVLAGNITGTVNAGEATHDNLKDGEDVLYVAGTLASTLTLKGKGSIAQTASATNVSTSHGVGSFTVESGSLYIQVLAYYTSPSTATLGGAAAGSPWNFCHSILTIEKTT